MKHMIGCGRFAALPARKLSCPRWARTKGSYGQSFSAQVSLRAPFGPILSANDATLAGGGAGDAHRFEASCDPGISGRGRPMRTKTNHEQEQTYQV